MATITSNPFSSDNYLLLLNLMYHVAQVLQGKKVADPRIPDCQQLAIKIYFHCSSIYWLSMGTRVPYPKPEGSFFFDHASVVVLARAVIETYLTMFEVFFGPTTDDEREFQHALWLLSGFILRENFSPVTSEFKSEYEESHLQVEEMRERIKNTRVFSKLSQKQQNATLKGVRKRNLRDVAKRAGIGEVTIRQVYDYQSSYVHSDGLSGVQITTAKTKAGQTQFIDIQMKLVMMIMAKMIVDYTRIFSESMEMAKAYEKSYKLAVFLSELASNLP